MVHDFSAVNRILDRIQGLPQFRSRYESIGAVTTAADFERIPLMTKEDFRAALGELRSGSEQQTEPRYLFSSGGTLGSPQLSLIPGHMFLDDILVHWHPLDRTDILCNMFLPGKLWSSHYFYNALGQRLARETIALGPVNEVEMDGWLRFLQEQGVTAIAATPTTLRHVLRFCHRNGFALPSVRKLLWVGEPFDDRELKQLVNELLPQAQTWGLYGSTETWVIGYNSPDCPHDTFHILPYQFVELIEGNEIAVTCLHPDACNILLRYRIGDSGEWSSCPCGHPGAALRVLGRKGGSLSSAGPFSIRSG